MIDNDYADTDKPLTARFMCSGFILTLSSALFASTMTLNIINELISSHSASTADSLNRLRLGILERTDGLKLEALSPSDAFGTRLLEFCNHTLATNVYATIVLLTIQAENISEANLLHMCNLTSRSVQDVPINLASASKTERKSLYIISKVDS
jgi:hypothetical protein